MLTIGIDVGTSTVSGVVFDTKTEEVKASVTVPGSPHLVSSVPGGAEQSPDALLGAARDVLAGLEEQTSGAAAIAFSTQMHGMLYIDEALRPLSPLFTWEDKRADLPVPEPSGPAEQDAPTERSAGKGVSLAERITGLTGYPAAAGYALATHCYNVRNGLVPEGTWKMVTAGDYCAAKLCEGGDFRTDADGLPNLVMHPSDAASFGLYSLSEGCFDRDALKKLEITPVILPRTGEYALAGHMPDGKAVYHAIGDNQAGFLGAAGQPGDVLINVGTSAQISAVPEGRTIADMSAQGTGIARELELRPYLGGACLVAGAALAGGSVLKSLNAFLLAAVRAADPDSAVTEHDLYAIMERLAEEAYAAGDVLAVDTRFGGTRTEPGLRGSVSGIDTGNLRPGALCAGAYRGIVKELYDYYCLMPREIREGTRRVILTGNAARKNPILLRIASDLFGKETALSPWTEDAAVGAARYAAMCAARTRLSDP